MHSKSILYFCLLLQFGFSSECMNRLMEGNKRYMADDLSQPDVSSYRREEILKKQKPCAVIVGCSDSRVPPEIIFNQGLGDVFTVRVAGNVVGPIELDSIEYAVKILGASVVMVLGHESCGAVTAVMNGQTADIEEIASLIQPAIKQAKTLEAATKDNIRWVVRYLQNTPLIKKAMSEKKVHCVGAYYHLGSGEVELL